MVQFEVKADFRKIQAWVKHIAAQQIPFMTAKTLTDLAGEVNSEAIKELGRIFILRNKYVIRSFRRVMAQKSQWPNCEAIAGSVADFMELHVRGGDKKAKGDIQLGVPMDARPNKSDIIPKPLWVRQLLKKAGYIHVIGSGGRELLLKQTQSGKKKVLKNAHPRKRRRIHHTGKRGWKRGTIYVLKKDVKIPARFDFESIAKKIVTEKSLEIFKRNFNEALSK